MTRLSNSLHRLIAAALCAGAFVAGSALGATAEPLDVDPEVLAKLALEKARANSLARQTANAGKKSQKNDQAAADCGAIAIGNVVGGSKIGFSPTDVNVVIVGDVINANNNCK